MDIFRFIVLPVSKAFKFGIFTDFYIKSDKYGEGIFSLF